MVAIDSWSAIEQRVHHLLVSFVRTEFDDEEVEERMGDVDLDTPMYHIMDSMSANAALGQLKQEFGVCETISLGIYTAEP